MTVYFSKVISTLVLTNVQFLITQLQMCRHKDKKFKIEELKRMLDFKRGPDLILLLEELKIIYYSYH
jgi:hypothetical protein